jgi:hypothetical protein
MRQQRWEVPDGRLRQITAQHILEMWQNDLERATNQLHIQRQHLEPITHSALITAFAHTRARTLDQTLAGYATCTIVRQKARHVVANIH